MWYLGPYQNIANEAQKLIEPVTEMTLNTYWNITEPEVPTEPTMPTEEKKDTKYIDLPVGAKNTTVSIRVEDADGNPYYEDFTTRLQYAKSNNPHKMKLVTRYDVEVTDPVNPEAEAVGVDVSKWQGSVNWVKMAQDRQFAFIRSSWGSSGVDSQFVSNWIGAKTQGIKRGAYHAYFNHVDAISQAAHFKNTVGDDIGELPPVLDVERTDHPVNPDDVLLCLIEIGRLFGRSPIIYTGAWWWDPNMGVQGWEEQFDLWVASYKEYPPVLPNAWSDYLIWQYTSSGDGVANGAEVQNF